MKTDQRSGLLEKISKLSNNAQILGPQEAENLLMEVLQPLLAEDGYEVSQTPAIADGGLDFVAKRQPSADYQGQTVGIQFKYYRSGMAVGAKPVERLIAAALLHELDRAILLVNSRFTQAARNLVSQEIPLQVELEDLDSLRAWADRIKIDQAGVGEEVRGILRIVSRRFATMIAENPRVLDELEWRDIERTIAEVFQGLGFTVTLTPASKDEGKDIVLECQVKGQRAEYIVEIKHWRSRNRVGGQALRDFLNVIVKEARHGGLFLSTYGYCDNAFEQLTLIDRQRLRFGSQEKVVALCRTYVKAESGIWSPPEHLAEVLYEGTS